MQEYNAASIAVTEVEKPRFDMSVERVAERKIKAEKIYALPVKNILFGNSVDIKTGLQFQKRKLGYRVRAGAALFTPL